MEYDITQDATHRTVSVKGCMSFKDLHTFSDLKKTFFSAESPRYVVDLANVDFIDSAGLGMLLIAREQARSLKAKIELCNPREEIKSILKSAQFQELFTCTC